MDKIERKLHKNSDKISLNNHGHLDDKHSENLIPKSRNLFPILQVVAGMLHKFDAQVKFSDNCQGNSNIEQECSNIKVLENLPGNCENFECYEVLDEFEIICQ